MATLTATTNESWQPPAQMFMPACWVYDVGCTFWIWALNCLLVFRSVCLAMCSVVREALFKQTASPASPYLFLLLLISLESLHWSYGRLQCRQDNTKHSLFKGDSIFFCCFKCAHAKPVSRAFSLQFTATALSGFTLLISKNFVFLRIYQFFPKNTNIKIQ